MNDHGSDFSFEVIDPKDKEIIDFIAAWYQKEWSIPPEITTRKLSNILKDGIPFHIIVRENNIPVATGGLHLHVGIQDLFPEFVQYEPWLALLYTIPEKRRQGIGAFICKTIEDIARKNNIPKLYLFTNTSENLYRRQSWTTTHRLMYKSKETVVMEKLIESH